VVPHLERDGVEDALSLAALEPSLADCEFGRVDADGQPRGVGLRDEHVEELLHGVLAVEEALVHIDVDHLSAAKYESMKNYIYIYMYILIYIQIHTNVHICIYIVQEALVHVDVDHLSAANLVDQTSACMYTLYIYMTLYINLYVYTMYL